MGGDLRFGEPDRGAPDGRTSVRAFLSRFCCFRCHWPPVRRRRTPGRLPSHRHSGRRRIPVASTDTPPEPPPPDPVLSLIAMSEAYFKAGQRELERATSSAARQEFDRPLDVLHGVALRRAHRAAHPRAFRPAGRPDQHVRGQGARRRRRLHREAVRAGVDRRTARAVGDLRPAAARQPRRSGDRSERPGVGRRTTSRFRSTSGCSPTSSCSRAGCTTSSRKA